NPFKKKQEILPGERVAVITDPDTETVDKGAAARPIALPAPVANASWTEPGGNATNGLGHLALGDRLTKVWRARAGTGSSSHGRLSAGSLLAPGHGDTPRA